MDSELSVADFDDREAICQLAFLEWEGVGRMESFGCYLLSKKRHREANSNRSESTTTHYMVNFFMVIIM